MYEIVYLSCFLQSVTKQGQLENEQSEEGSIQTQEQTFADTHPWPYNGLLLSRVNHLWDSPHRQTSPAAIPTVRTMWIPALDMAVW